MATGVHGLHRASSRLLLAAALAGAASLAGCGRKGPLEPPLGLSPTRTTAQENSTAAQTRILNNPDIPGLIQSPNQVYEESAIAKLNSAVKNPGRPINAPPPDAARGGFLLDPLVR